MGKVFWGTTQPYNCHVTKPREASSFVIIIPLLFMLSNNNFMMVSVILNLKDLALLLTTLCSNRGVSSISKYVGKKLG